MEKVVVLGSNSFSGSHLIDLLLEKTCYHIIGISRSPEKNPVFLPYKKRDLSRFTFFQMDLNKDSKKIIKLFDKEKPMMIVNFAAQSEVGPSWITPEHWFRTNCLGIVNLTNELKNKKYLTKYVHISSPEVYGTCKGVVTEDAPFNPSTPYAVSKAAGDMFIQTLIKNFDFPAILIRSTNVYGPGQQLFKIIPRTIIYLKMGKKIQLHGGGQAVKSYIHIHDISLGELAAMERGRPGTIFHLSPNRGYKVRDVVKQICEIMGFDFNSSTMVVDERLGQDAAYVIDSTRAQKELSWHPKISLKKGLIEVISWIEDNWAQIKNEPMEYIHKP